MDAWNLFQKERNTVSEYFWSCDSFTQPIYSPLLLISWNLNRSLLHKVTPNTTRDSCTVQPECLVQSGRFIVPIFHAYSWLCARFSLPPAWNILSFRFWSQLRASSSMKNSWILQPSVTPSVDVCCLTPHPSFPPSEVPHSVWQVLLGRFHPRSKNGIWALGRTSPYTGLPWWQLWFRERHADFEVLLKCWDQDGLLSCAQTRRHRGILQNILGPRASQARDEADFAEGKEEKQNIWWSLRYPGLSDASPKPMKLSTHLWVSVHFSRILLLATGCHLLWAQFALMINRTLLVFGFPVLWTSNYPLFNKVKRFLRVPRAPWSLLCFFLV